MERTTANGPRGVQKNSQKDMSVYSTVLPIVQNVKAKKG